MCPYFLTEILADRRALVEQINARINRQSAMEIMVEKVVLKCLQALQDTPFEADTTNTLHTIITACTYLVQTRQFVQQCLVAEFYSPFLLCTAKALPAAKSVDHAVDDSDSKDEVVQPSSAAGTMVAGPWSGPMALSLFVYHVRQLDKNTNLLQSLVDQMSTDSFHVRNVTDVDVLVALIQGQKQHILDTFQFILTDQVPPGLTAVAKTTRPPREVCHRVSGCVAAFHDALSFTFTRASQLHR